MIAYVLGLTLLAAAPVQPQDGSWAGWHGCWRAVDDASAGRVLCLLPAANAADAMLAVVENGAITERVTVHTNGQPYAVEQGGCRGMETGQWSANRRRVFVRAELDCEGVKRMSSSVLAMVAGNEWVDVQTISIHGQNAVRVVRYRPTTTAGMPAEIVAAIDDSRALARESARLHASAPLEVADVVEATRLLPPEGVQALIAERNNTFGINAQKLAELENANVPKSVIDVMIAVSYPKTFVIAGNEPAQRIRPAADRPTTYGYRNERMDSCYDSWNYSSRYYFAPFGRFGFYDDCYMRYNRYGWGSRYGYGYNYGYYGWNTGPAIVIVRPDDQGSRAGSMIKGGGYTQGGSSSTTRRTTDSGAGSRSGTTTSSGTSSTGTSSTGTTSSGSTGRTAIPRGSGGGGGGS